MGMDVYGKHPKNNTGRYFGRQIWAWDALWTACAAMAPNLCGKVRYGYGNDGDGLDIQGATALAAELEAACNDGRVAKYCDQRNEHIANLADQACNICGGTGRRMPPPESGPEGHLCNQCGGTGKFSPWETYCDVSPEDVREFVAFLKECGGFEIW